MPLSSSWAQSTLVWQSVHHALSLHYRFSVDSYYSLFTMPRLFIIGLIYTRMESVHRALPLNYRYQYGLNTKNRLFTIPQESVPYHHGSLFTYPCLSVIYLAYTVRLYGWGPFTMLCPLIIGLINLWDTVQHALSFHYWFSLGLYGGLFPVFVSSFQFQSRLVWQSVHHASSVYDTSSLGSYVGLFIMLCLSISNLV